MILHDTSVPDLAIQIRGALDRRFFVLATPRLRQMLHRTRANLTLHLSGPEIPRVADLERLLHRLKRYGDRVFVVMDKNLMGRLTVDSSVFNVILTPTDGIDIYGRRHFAKGFLM